MELLDDVQPHLRQFGLAEDDDLVNYIRACETRERVDGENAMYLHCERGDIQLYWSRRNSREVAYARKVFDQAKGAGNLVYKRKAGSDRGEVMNEFEDAAEGLEIVVTRPMAGG